MLLRTRNPVYQFLELTSETLTVSGGFGSRCWSLNLGSVMASLLLKLQRMSVMMSDWPATDPWARHGRIKLISFLYLQQENTTRSVLSL